MNKHFEDAVYYLKRAAEHAKQGVKEGIEPIEGRIRSLTGKDEEEPEPGRLQAVIDDVKALEEKAEGEARDALGSARQKIEQYRDTE